MMYDAVGRNHTSCQSNRQQNEREGVWRGTMERHHRESSTVQRVHTNINTVRFASKITDQHISLWHLLEIASTLLLHDVTSSCLSMHVHGPLSFVRGPQWSRSRLQVCKGVSNHSSLLSLLFKHLLHRHFTHVHCLRHVISFLAKHYKPRIVISYSDLCKKCHSNTNNENSISYT